MTVSTLTSGANSSNLTAYSSASVTPTAGRLYLAFFACSSTSAPTPTVTATGLGLTWTLIDRNDTTFTRSGYVFRATGTPSTGAVTFTGSAGMTAGLWVVAEVDGADLTTPVAQFVKARAGGNELSCSVAFDSAVDSGNEAVALVGFEGTQEASVPGTGWTLMADEVIGQPSSSLSVQHAEPPQQNITASWTTANRWYVIGVEIKAAAAGAPSSGTATGTTTWTGTAVGTAPGVAPPPAMETWQAALDNQATTPAVWLAIGDSITEGQGASTRANRWIDKALASIRSDVSATGGVGYLPGWYATYGPDSAWQPYSGRSGSVSNVPWGADLGERTAQLSTVGSSQTYTVTGTHADIWWLSNGGIFTWAVDGGATTSVDTAGTYSGNNRTRISLGASGSHTVTITATTVPLYLAGLAVFDGDRDAGVHLYDAGHTGWTSSQFTDDQANQLDQMAAIAATAGVDLVTIALGANDWSTGATAATLKANVQTIITRLRLHIPNASFVVVVMYERGDLAAGGWATYRSALLSIATDDPTVSVLDFYDTMGRATSSGYWRSDAIHPSDTGHTFMANQAATLLGADVSTDLVVDGARAATRATSPLLEQAQPLVVQGARAEARASAPLLTQTADLAVDGARADTRASEVTLGAEGDLLVHGARTATRASSPLLTQATDLIVHGARAETRAVEVTLTADPATDLAVHSARAETRATAAALDQLALLTISGARAPTRASSPRLTAPTSDRVITLTVTPGGRRQLIATPTSGRRALTATGRTRTITVTPR